MTRFFRALGPGCHGRTGGGARFSVVRGGSSFRSPGGRGPGGGALVSFFLICASVLYFRSGIHGRVVCQRAWVGGWERVLTLEPLRERRQVRGGTHVHVGPDPPCHWVTATRPTSLACPPPTTHVAERARDRPGKARSPCGCGFFLSIFVYLFDSTSTRQFAPVSSLSAVRESCIV